MLLNFEAHSQFLSEQAGARSLCHIHDEEVSWRRSFLRPSLRGCDKLIVNMLDNGYGWCLFCKDHWFLGGSHGGESWEGLVVLEH